MVAVAFLVVVVFLVVAVAAGAEMDAMGCGPLQRDECGLFHQQMHDSAAAAADGLSHLPDCE